MRGTYKYFLNNEPTGIVETFKINKLSKGTIRIVSERDASQYGTKILVEYGQLRNEPAYFFSIRMLNRNNPQVADVFAYYDFKDDKLFFSRQINDKQTGKETIKLPENCIVFPLMRCFQGETILRVAENKSFSNVLVPSIENPEDSENLLRPTFDERTAELIEKETIQINKKSIETSVYKYLSKHYSEDSKFWIDENGLLVKYIFHQSEDKVWKTILS